MRKRICLILTLLLSGIGLGGFAQRGRDNVDPPERPQKPLAAISSGLSLRDPAPEILGTWWDQQEGGWRGEWIRRGTSNRFDARYYHPGKGESHRAILTIEVYQDGGVYIERRQTTGGNDCDYWGQIGRYKAHGQYTCGKDLQKMQAGQKYKPHGTWSATINH